MLAAHLHLLHIGRHSAEGLCDLGVAVHGDCATCDSAWTVTHNLSQYSL